jgi:hypothetical protein
MSQYYFLASMLPPLEIGHRPLLPYEELKSLLDEALTPFDNKKLVLLRRLVDIGNIRSFICSEPLAPWGNLSYSQLEEALTSQEGLPDYVFDFYNKHSSHEERIRHFSQLFASFFEEAISQTTGFLRDYFIFEREWRLIMMGFRAKKLNRDLVAELQYEDPEDLTVAHLLAQKDARSYEPPHGYEDLKEVFHTYTNNPMKLYKHMCNYRFYKIEECERGELFSLDVLLSYIARLMIVEKWIELELREDEIELDSLMKGYNKKQLEVSA